MEPRHQQPWNWLPLLQNIQGSRWPQFVSELGGICERIGGNLWANWGEFVSELGGICERIGGNLWANWGEFVSELGGICERIGDWLAAWSSEQGHSNCRGDSGSRWGGRYFYNHFINQILTVQCTLDISRSLVHNSDRMPIAHPHNAPGRGRYGRPIWVPV